MGEAISGGGALVVVTADTPSSVPLTVAGNDPGPQTGNLLLGQYTVAGVAYNIFALGPSGQLRVAGAADDTQPYPNGLKLVSSFAGGATDFDINNDTNSFLLVMQDSPTGTFGKKVAYVAKFTPSGAKAYMMLADDLISGDVANGWILSRALKVNVGATPAAVGGLVGSLNSTGRTTSLTSTALLASAPIGTYAVQVYIEDQTAGGGTVTTSISFKNSNGTTVIPLSFWNPNVGAQVQAVILNGAAVTDFSSVFQLYNFSAFDIAISTVVTGTVQYSIRARLIRID